MTPPEADRRPGDETPPASVEEALTRAAQHGRVAASEAVAALRALVEAGSLAATGATPSERTPLGTLIRALDELSLVLGRSGTHSSRLLEAVLDALDTEIARWEERARSDEDARSVLRAYLGVREVLWELGVRRREPASETGTRESPRPGARRGPRVQRVRIED